MTKRPFFKYVFLLLAVICSLGVSGQQADAMYTKADKEAFERYVDYILSYRNQPLNEVIIASGEFFLDRPYVAQTLEEVPEQLVVNLRELDCTTFVETVLALSRTVKSGDITFENFQSELQQIRYRGGIIGDYTSRLHYMTEWIDDNEKAGIVKDITREIGGIPFNIDLHFMSIHPESYKQLADPLLVEEMRIIEQRINRQAQPYYIPKAQASRHLSQLRDGDIVLFTTSITGLDVTHVGFIYKREYETSFIHASTGAKKVVINEVPLTEYMARIKSNTGMIILRPVENGNSFN